MPCSQPNWKGQKDKEMKVKEKEKDLELSISERLAFNKGVVVGRDGAIKEIEKKLFITDILNSKYKGDKFIMISRKEWEGFCNNTSAYQRKGDSLTDPLKKELRKNGKI